MKFDVNKHIKFEFVETPDSKKRKTNFFEVWNTQQNCIIGYVKWFTNWRHYCFFPERDTIFSDRCLVKIGEFVEQENIRHKLSIQMQFDSSHRLKSGVSSEEFL